MDRGPIVDGVVDRTITPDKQLDAGQGPEASSVEGAVSTPDTTIDSSFVDAWTGPDSTVDGPLPDRSVDTFAPDSTVDTLSPDSTVDSAPPPPPAVNLCTIGWCLEGTNQYGWPALGLYGVWASSPTDVVVVGDGGKIYRFDGTTWTADASPVTTDLRRVHGSSPTDIFAVGDKGTIIHYDGTSWSEHSYSGTLASVTFKDVYSWAPGEFVTGGSGGYVAWWALGDFVDYVDFPGAPDIRAVAGTSATDLVAGGSGGKLYTCTDRTSWIDQSSNQPWGAATIGAIADRGDGTLLLGAGNSIYRRTGTSWQLQHSSTQRTWTYDIWGSGASDVWSIDEYGKIWRYDGTAWSSYPELIDFLSDGVASGPSFGLAVGEYGMVMHWDGNQLREMFPGQGYSSSTMLKDVWATSTTEAFIVGNLHTGVAALERTASGYAEIAGPGAAFNQSLSGIWGTSATNLYAVGPSGTALHYDGTAWSDAGVGAGNGLYLNDVWGRSATDIWIVGGTSTSSTSFHYDGTSWQPVSTPAPKSLLGVGGDATRTYAVGNQGVVLRLEGQSWVDDGPTGTTSLFETVWVQPGGDPLIGGLGGLKRRTASGWIDVSYPAALGNSIKAICGTSNRILLVSAFGIAQGGPKSYLFTQLSQSLPGATSAWCNDDSAVITNHAGATLVQAP